MAYRTDDQLCTACSRAPAAPCRNCGASHCRAHLVDGSCHPCFAELLRLEQRHVRRAGILYAAVTLPLMALALGLSTAGVPALIGFLMLAGWVPGFFATQTLSRKLGHRRLRHRRLLPTPQPPPPPLTMTLPPAASQSPQGSKSRRRRRRGVGTRRSPKLPAAIGRGLHFD